MKTVLVVCTANICRSPMAAAILRHHLGREGLSQAIEVTSAGIWAYRGYAASSNGIAALAARGIELGDHRSQPVTHSLLEQADLILVMEEAHRSALFHAAPEHLRKVHLLTEIVGKHEDVEDPYGGPLEEYARTASYLGELIEAGFAHILDLLGVKPIEGCVQS